MALITRYINFQVSAGGSGSITDPYSSLSEWDTNEATDLPSGVNSHIVFIQGSGTETYDTTNWTTDIDNNLTLQAWPGFEHNGIKTIASGTNTAIIVADNTFDHVFSLDTNYVTLRDLEIKQEKSGDSVEGVRIEEDRTGVIDRCLIWSKVLGTNQDGIYIGPYSASGIVTNSIIDLWSRAGINAQGFTNNIYIVHYTITNCIVNNTALMSTDNAGINVEQNDFSSPTGSGRTIMNINNTAVFNTIAPGVEDFNEIRQAGGDGRIEWNGTNNVSQDSSAVDKFTSSTSGVTLSVADGAGLRYRVTSLASGFEDYNPQLVVTGTEACIDQGTSILDVDITGFSRLQGIAHDVGPYEFDHPDTLVTTYIDFQVSPGGSGTIGDPYSSLAEWDTAEATNLITADASHIVFIKGSGTERWDAVNWTTRADRNLTLEAWPGFQHQGVKGGFGTFIETPTSNGHGIQLDTGYCTLRGLEFKLNSTSNSDEGIRIFKDRTGVIDRCLVWSSIGNSNQDGIYIGGYAASGIVTNSIVDLWSRSAITAQGFVSGVFTIDMTITNCLVNNHGQLPNGNNEGGINATQAYALGTRNMTVNNTAVFNGSGQTNFHQRFIEDAGSINWQGTNNISEDASAESRFSSSHGSVTFSVEDGTGERYRATNLASGLEDYTPQLVALGTERCIDQGLSILDVDIIGFSRLQGDGPDIGPFEFDHPKRLATAYIDFQVSAGGSGTIDDPYSSLAEWDTTEATDLIAADFSHIVFIRGSGQEKWDAANWTTNVDRNLTLEAWPGFEHRGIKSTAAGVNSTTRIANNTGGHVIELDTGYCTLRGLEFKQQSTNDSDEGIRIFKDRTGVIDRCLVWSSMNQLNQDGIYMGPDSASGIVTNSIVDLWSRAGINSQNFASRPGAHLKFTITNCIVNHTSVLPNPTIDGGINAMTASSDTATHSMIINNTAVFNTDQGLDDFNWHETGAVGAIVDWTGTNNVSQDESAVEKFSGSFSGVTLSVVDGSGPRYRVTNLASGFENYTPQIVSNGLERCIDKGTSILDTDMLNINRPEGNEHDIGPFEFIQGSRLWLFF